MARRKAFITGITGQDGSYLAEFLLAKGYEVHGLLRGKNGWKGSFLEPLAQQPGVNGGIHFGNEDDTLEGGSQIAASTPLSGGILFGHVGDILDSTRIRSLLGTIKPDEVYHLAGQSQAGASFDLAEVTVQSVALATVQLLESLRLLSKVPRLFYASSSEVFGNPTHSPQTEGTPFRPKNPYGAAKALATDLVRIYRDQYHLPWVSGILYNHESPRRGMNFVTRKICRAAAAISLGLQKELVLGEIRAQRDWGDARDYVEAMWRMLQQDDPKDCILATGTLHSVEDLLNVAFQTVNTDWHPVVRQDPRWVRPQEPVPLVGDPTLARTWLGWKPAYSFEHLIADMVHADLVLLKAHPEALSEQHSS
jgi:GDPmannose 4,6-dehydratase